MKRRKWVRLILTNILMVIIIILPFLSGPPNRVVIVLSAIAQSVGFFGLVLVPVGLCWLLYWFFQLQKNLRDLSLIPLYLLTLPLVAFASRSYMTEPLSKYSRNQAIEKSQIMIDAIDRYKIAEGHYPNTLQELRGKYLDEIPRPSVMGILGFRYNHINDRYSLSFSQWLEIGSLEQIVLYDQDNLRNNLTGEFARYDYQFDLCRVKGAFAVLPAGYPGWQYYQVD